MKTVSLLEARERAGLTQDELAALAAVPQSVISKLETADDPRPQFSTVMKLAKALKRRPESLKFGTAA